MLLLRQFTDPNTVGQEVELDEMDANLLQLYITRFLMDTKTYEVRVKRFWDKQVSSVQDVE